MFWDILNFFEKSARNIQLDSNSLLPLCLNSFVDDFLKIKFNKRNHLPFFFGYFFWMKSSKARLFNWRTKKKPIINIKFTFIPFSNTFYIYFQFFFFFSFPKKVRKKKKTKSRQTDRHQTFLHRFVHADGQNFVRYCLYKRSNEQIVRLPFIDLCNLPLLAANFI